MEHTDCRYGVGRRERLGGGGSTHHRHCSMGKQTGEGEFQMVVLEKGSSEGPECGGGRDGGRGRGSQESDTRTFKYLHCKYGADGEVILHF